MATVTPLDARRAARERREFAAEVAAEVARREREPSHASEGSEPTLRLVK